MRSSCRLAVRPAPGARLRRERRLRAATTIPRSRRREKPGMSYHERSRIASRPGRMSSSSTGRWHRAPEHGVPPCHGSRGRRRAPDFCIPTNDPASSTMVVHRGRDRRPDHQHLLCRSRLQPEPLGPEWTCSIAAFEHPAPSRSARGRATGQVAAAGPVYIGGGAIFNYGLLTGAEPLPEQPRARTAA